MVNTAASERKLNAMEVIEKAHLYQDVASTYETIVEGYFSEMGSIITPMERKLFVYSGKFIIYMRALRFLTDYLNADIYYQTTYPEHNLMRAKNQFALLDSYYNTEGHFQQILDTIINKLPVKDSITLK